MWRHVSRFFELGRGRGRKGGGLNVIVSPPRPLDPELEEKREGEGDRSYSTGSYPRALRKSASTGPAMPHPMTPTRTPMFECVSGLAGVEE